jgi:hypothetical protein
MRKMRGRLGVSGKVVVILVLIAAAAGPLTVYVYLNLIPHTIDSIHMKGSLLVNAPSHTEGGSGFPVTYNASLSVRSGSGSLNLTLSGGVRDILLEHRYTVSNLIANETTVSMLLNGNPVTLILIANDSSGGQFSGSYVASNGPNGQKGSISPSFFGGLGSQYNVQLQLIPVAAPRPTFMQIRPPDMV